MSREAVLCVCVGVRGSQPTGGIQFMLQANTHHNDTPKAQTRIKALSQSLNQLHHNTQNHYLLSILSHQKASEAKTLASNDNWRKNHPRLAWLSLGPNNCLVSLSSRNRKLITACLAQPLFPCSLVNSKQ